MPLHYWRGRAQQEIGQTGPAAESYKQFVALRGSAKDPLVDDARARLAKLAS